MNKLFLIMDTPKDKESPYVLYLAMTAKLVELIYGWMVVVGVGLGW